MTVKPQFNIFAFTARLVNLLFRIYYFEIQSLSSLLMGMNYNTFGNFLNHQESPRVTLIMLSPKKSFRYGSPLHEMGIYVLKTNVQRSELFDFFDI
jgi:hypothetical protein